VEEIVPIGSLDPDVIHLPGIYVTRMTVDTSDDKKIEFELFVRGRLRNALEPR